VEEIPASWDRLLTGVMIVLAMVGVAGGVAAFALVYNLESRVNSFKDDQVAALTLRVLELCMPNMVPQLASDID
jgi:hypothetical protein